MRVERLSGTPEDVVAEIRALVPGGASVRRDVEAIVEGVRTGGDEVLGAYAARFDDSVSVERVPSHELDGAADRQPGRPQAQGGGDRRPARTAACALSG